MPGGRLSLIGRLAWFIKPEFVKHRPPGVPHLSALPSGFLIAGHSRETVGVRAGALSGTQRGERQGQQHALSHHRTQIDHTVTKQVGLALNGVALEDLAHISTHLRGHLTQTASTQARPRGTNRAGGHNVVTNGFKHNINNRLAAFGNAGRRHSKMVNGDMAFHLTPDTRPAQKVMDRDADTG